MRKDYFSRIAMMVVTRDYLSQNVATTTSVTQFAPLSTQYTAGVAQLQTYRELIATDRSGVAENKSAIRLDLVYKVCDLASRVLAYAKLNANQVLEAELAYTDSRLKRMGGASFRDFAQLVHTRANSNLTALAPYGVTAAMLTTFKTAVDAYAVALPKTALVRKERKTTYAQMEMAFKDLGALLLKMDSVIELLRFSQPAFYKGYQEARRVDALPSQKHAVRGKVVDAATGESLKGVSFAFVPATAQAFGLRSASTEPQTPVLSKKSARKGGFQVPKLPEGDYLLTISKYGYSPKQISFSVNNGECSVLSVQLEPNGDQQNAAS